MDTTKGFSLTDERDALPAVDDESRSASERGVWQNLGGDFAGARPPYLAALGFAGAMQGKHRRCAGDSRPLGRRRPRNVLAWDNLGKLLLRARWLAEAEHCWRQAIQAAPSQTPLHAALGTVVAFGTVVAGQERLKEASEILRRAVMLDVGSGRAWEQLGVVLFLRQNLGSAADAFERAATLDAGALSARYHLSLFHTARGKTQGGCDEVARILDTDPEHVVARIDLALHVLTDSRPAPTLAELDRAFAAEPSNSWARVYRAVVPDLAGRRAEAEEALPARTAEAEGTYADRARHYLTDRMRKRTAEG